MNNRVKQNNHSLTANMLRLIKMKEVKVLSKK